MSGRWGNGSWPLQGFAGLYIAQLSRVHVARIPLLFVATLQSLGILVLLRGVVDHGDARTGSTVVAGAAVLVVAFVAVNLLAQRFGQLRATKALDYYAAVPVSFATVVLGTASAFATFTIPGALVTTLAGLLLYGLPVAHAWLALPIIVSAGCALAGVGAALGLAMPRPELATLAGQLGMTLVLFLGVIPAEHLPVPLRVVRFAMPSTPAVDAMASVLRAEPSAADLTWCVIGGLLWGFVSLTVATRCFRRALRA